MKRELFRKRQRSTTPPSNDELRMAEAAMYTAVCRGGPKNILVSQTSTTRRVTVVLKESNTSEPRDPLAELGDTSVEDFESNFRINSLECMTTVYESIYHVHASSINGSLTTALPEDVFHLIDSQLCLLDDYLAAKGWTGTAAGNDVIVEAILTTLQNLSYHQKKHRYSTWRNVETCAAAANDSMRMIEKLEEMMNRNKEQYRHLCWEDSTGCDNDNVTLAIRSEAAELTRNFSADAVCAARRASGFIMHSLQTSTIPNNLFGLDWEDKLVHNELAVSIVRTYADYLIDLENYLEHEFLFHKVVASLVRATTCFYIRCFVKKAEKMRKVMKRDFANQRAQRVAFLSAKRAMTRIKYDVQIFRDYFESLAKESAVLKRLVADEMSVFVILLECMALAIDGPDDETLDKYIVVVHKKITGANGDVTRFFLSDLWLLMGPKNTHVNIEEKTQAMDVELGMVSSGMKERRQYSTLESRRDESTDFGLDQMLRTFYQDRILQQKSVCANLMREIQDLRLPREDGTDEPKVNISKMPQWKPLRRLREHLVARKADQPPSSLFLDTHPH